MKFKSFFTIGGLTVKGYDTNRPHALVAKFNSNGDLIWYNVISGNPGDYTFSPEAITTDIEGSVYVAGNGYYSISFYKNSNRLG